ncbi:MAG: heliorhodopsin HeR [Candidatus Bathyarchaeota archaeon]|nr:heliorhodopsin HeR [Candidatus Bathyarchaeota archaeon]
MDNKERLERIQSSPISFSHLKKLNAGAGVLHLINSVAMLALGFTLTWSRDIYTFYLQFAHVTPTSPAIYAYPNPEVFFTINNLGLLLAAFPLISAIAHFLIAFPKNQAYNSYLKKGMNPYRWYEYALSSSIMIVVIATFVGVWDFWSLSMIFLLNALMIMFGYLMEVINQKTEKTSWSAFILGCISGGFPWLVLFAYFTSAITSTGAEVPTFVYLILFIYFALFMSFALNMLLQYKGVGGWKDYLYGERAYIILSFIAKTFLVWMVFSGVYAPF